MSMEYIKTTGVVLRRKIIKEGDAIISVLTPELGVITAFVKGAKNYKNRNSQGSSPFSYSEFVLSAGKDMYKVKSCVLLESFYNLSTNIERIAYATYIADLVEFSVKENIEDERILPFVLNTFFLLANSDKSLKLIKCVFELKLLCFLGLTPELFCCNKCGSEETYSLSAQSGGTLCRLCTKTEMEISKPVLSAMRYVIEAENNKAYSFSLASELISEFENHTSQFIKEYIDRDFYSLVYLNKIIGK